jgi:uncharacterized protein
MPRERLHRFELGGHRFAIDVDTCFCFQCDDISWDVLEYYPHEPVNRIYHLLGEKHDREELQEVVGELEWLRNTNSILPRISREQQAKDFEFDRGLKRLTVLGIGAHAGAAVHLLLNRSEAHRALELEFWFDGAIRDPARLAALCDEAFAAASLAGKTLEVHLRVRDLEVGKRPHALEGHAIHAQLEFKDRTAAAKRIGAFAKARLGTLSRLRKALGDAADGYAGRIIVRPEHPAYGGAAAALREAGFSLIEVALDEAFVVRPELEIAAMFDGLRETADYYAERLLGHEYFRLDPIASLFWRIHNGTPIRRADPVGTNALAVGEDGAIYSSPLLSGDEAFRLGSIAEGVIDEDAVRAYEDVGTLTTSVCMKCWARSLCGGGSASVHHALTGNFREPNETWCSAQRAWMSAAVAAFNTLSSSGVNFTRVYSNLDATATARPSLFTLARAAFRMNIGMRPLAEADAELLAGWENWNRSAYFLLNERNIGTANQYDREMDALHPRPGEFETLLLHKNGDPFGLFKIRPDTFPGVAEGFLYFHDADAYDSDAVRKSFRMVLKEASGQQAIQRLTVAAAIWEEGLMRFLEGVGFTREGVLREAIYARGKYHDVVAYRIAPESL